MDAEQQEENRNKTIKKIEAVKQMHGRAVRTRFMLIIIFFVGIGVFMFSSWSQWIVYIGEGIIIIASVLELKRENDFVRHLKENYGVK